MSIANPPPYILYCVYTTYGHIIYNDVTVIHYIIITFSNFSDCMSLASL